MSLNLSAIAVRERAVTLFFILLLAAGGNRFPPQPQAAKRQ